MASESVCLYTGTTWIKAIVPAGASRNQIGLPDFVSGLLRGTLPAPGTSQGLWQIRESFVPPSPLGCVRAITEFVIVMGLPVLLLNGRYL
jgi:hypothetical protein